MCRRYFVLLGGGAPCSMYRSSGAGRSGCRKKGPTSADCAISTAPHEAIPPHTAPRSPLPCRLRPRGLRRPAKVGAVLQRRRLPGCEPALWLLHAVAMRRVPRGLRLRGRQPVQGGDVRAAVQDPEGLSDRRRVPRGSLRRVSAPWEDPSGFVDSGGRMPFSRCETGPPGAHSAPARGVAVALSGEPLGRSSTSLLAMVLSST